MSTLSEYMRFQHLDTMQREQLTLDGLNKMIKYAKQLPFYRTLYKGIDQITTIEKLQTIPIITKGMLLETQEKWYFDDYIQLIQTSGTSGYSLSIPFCKRGIGVYCQPVDYVSLEGSHWRKALERVNRVNK